jgi:hypothetical protein
MSQTGNFPSVRDVRSNRVTRGALPILISVPRFQSTGLKNRYGHAERPYHPNWRRGVVSRQPRRRLRRGVRITAWALLGLAPITVAAGFARSGHTARTPAKPSDSMATRTDPLERVCLSQPSRQDGSGGARRNGAFERAAVTLLSIDAANVATGSETERAVILPGYLLPDNSREERVHEGS